MEFITRPDQAGSEGELDDEPKTGPRKTEGHRIDHVINQMRKVGCIFNSGEVPVFMRRGSLEFWEGDFFYGPGKLPLQAKVTLDHNFITLKSTKIIKKEDFVKFREHMHLLLTANQCHYYVEPVDKTPDILALHMAKYLYTQNPPTEEVQVALDMLSHAVHDIDAASGNGFREWQPRFKP